LYDVRPHSTIAMVKSAFEYWKCAVSFQWGNTRLSGRKHDLILTGIRLINKRQVHLAALQLKKEATKRHEKDLQDTNFKLQHRCRRQLPSKHCDT